MLVFGFGLMVVVLSVVLIFGLRAVARRFGLVDQPIVGGRKVHKKPVPLGGGIAIFFALIITITAILLTRPELLTINMTIRQLAIVALGGFIIMIGGTLDDKFKLKPRTQIIFPIIAILLVAAFAIDLTRITNPFGGVISLDHFFLLGDTLVFLWLLGMTYTTKLLDGLDGLATGVVGIGALMIFALSQFTKFYQPDVALLAALLAATCAAFLLFNFHPASIFLGEGGSLFLGFMLGVLAIISGGKIATTLLVMGLPILDVAWVIIRRIMQKRPVTAGDAGHLHHRLLKSGFTHRSAVVFLYVISAAFGSLTLVLQSKEKLLALGMVVVFMIGLGVWLGRQSRASS